MFIAHKMRGWLGSEQVRDSCGQARHWHIPRSAPSDGVSGQSSPNLPPPLLGRMQERSGVHPRVSGNRRWVHLPRCSIPQADRFPGQELVTSQRTEQGGLPPCVRSPGLSTGSEDCPQREEGDANQPRATHTGTWAGGAGLQSGDRSLALICLQLCSLGRGPAVLSSTIKLKNKMRWNIKPIKLSETNNKNSLHVFSA